MTGRICEQRDPKGLYPKARVGQIKNFTGLDSLHETPFKPETIPQLDSDTKEVCVKKILNFLQETGYVKKNDITSLKIKRPW